MFNFILHSAIDFEKLKKADVSLNAILFCDLSGGHSPFFSFTQDSYKEYEKYLGSRHPKRENFFQYDIYKGLRENLDKNSYVDTVRFYFLCVMACFVGEGFALCRLPLDYSWKAFEKAFTVLSEKCDFSKSNTFLEDWKYFWWGFEALFGDKYGCCSPDEYSPTSFRKSKVGLYYYLFSNGYFMEILNNKKKLEDCVKPYTDYEINHLTQIIEDYQRFKKNYTDYDFNQEKQDCDNLINGWINERNVLQDLLEYSLRKDFPMVIQYCNNCGRKLFRPVEICHSCKNDLTVESGITKLPKYKVVRKTPKYEGIEVACPEVLDSMIWGCYR